MYCKLYEKDSDVHLTESENEMPVKKNENSVGAKCFTYCSGKNEEPVSFV